MDVSFFSYFENISRLKHPEKNARVVTIMTATTFYKTDISSNKRPKTERILIHVI